MLEEGGEDIVRAVDSLLKKVATTFLDDFWRRMKDGVLQSTTHVAIRGARGVSRACRMALGPSPYP